MNSKKMQHPSMIKTIKLDIEETSQHNKIYLGQTHRQQFSMLRSWKPSY